MHFPIHDDVVTANLVSVAASKLTVAGSQTCCMEDTYFHLLSFNVQHSC
jgi:hypothetical protein